MPEVPAGPAWLHEIALQDYDYFSKNGQGWFVDIDAACSMIEPADRHRALFCLHGWYDQIGRYCFNPLTKQFDATWNAFPFMRDPALQARSQEDPVQRGIPAQANMVYHNLEAYHPVPLSWDEMRARLRYAKERGLRTAVYALCGLQMSGEMASHANDGTGLATSVGLWQGPDLMGSTYIANPLHPAVRDQVLAYLRALLQEVDEWTDALVMDETYYVGRGTLGPQACPGYADRAQMTLIQECAALCHHVRPDLAFLTADLLGTSWLELEITAMPLDRDASFILANSYSSRRMCMTSSSVLANENRSNCSSVIPLSIIP